MVRVTVPQEITASFNGSEESAKTEKIPQDLLTSVGHVGCAWVTVSQEIYASLYDSEETAKTEKTPSLRPLMTY